MLCPESIRTSVQADTRSSKLNPTPAVERVVAFDLACRLRWLDRSTFFNHAAEMLPTTIAAEPRAAVLLHRRVDAESKRSRRMSHRICHVDSHLVPIIVAIR